MALLTLCQVAHPSRSGIAEDFIGMLHVNGMTLAWRLSCAGLLQTSDIV